MILLGVLGKLGDFVQNARFWRASRDFLKRELLKWLLDNGVYMTNATMLRRRGVLFMLEYLCAECNPHRYSEGFPRWMFLAL